MLGQRHRRETEQSGDGLGAGRRDQLHERDDLLQRERAGHAVLLDLRVHQSADQVVLGVGAPLLHQLREDGERLVVDLAALRDQFAIEVASRHATVFDVQALVGLGAELCRVALGIADEGEDDRGREQPGERVDVVELVLAVDGVEEVVGRASRSCARGRRCAGA